MSPTSDKPHDFDRVAGAQPCGWPRLTTNDLPVLLNRHCILLQPQIPDQIAH